MEWKTCSHSLWTTMDVLALKNKSLCFSHPITFPMCDGMMKNYIPLEKLNAGCIYGLSAKSNVMLPILDCFSIIINMVLSVGSGAVGNELYVSIKTIR